MSHFSVLAIQKAKCYRDINDMMAPYDENLETEPRIYRTKQEVIEREKNRLANLLSNSLIKEYLDDPEEFKKNNSEYKIEWVEARLQEYYKYAAGSYNDEDYYKSAIEGEDPDKFDEDGNELTTYNEDAKYDYYCEGGRWDGMIILKDGSHADQAEMKDVDWEAMNKLTADQEKHIRDLWRIYIEKKGTKKEEEEFLKEHPFIYKESYYKDRYGTVEEHLRQDALWSTFAVVDENGWHEQGQMGWFGCSSETPEEAGDWTSKFEERFIKDLEPDDVITVLDCHI